MSLFININGTRYQIRKEKVSGDCTGCSFYDKVKKCNRNLYDCTDLSIIFVKYNIISDNDEGECEPKIITSFQSFDKVLYRNSTDEKWVASFISYKDSDYSCYMMDNSNPKYVIPYNDDTKHLWNNTDEAPKEYIWW